MDLKIKDVAELLSVSETTIRRWLAEGKIPAYRLHHQYRFSRIEIENWMMSFRVDQKGEDFFPREVQESDEDTPQEVKKGNQQYSFFRAVHQGGVHYDAKSKNKTEIITNTVSEIAQKLSLDGEVISELLLDREKLMPTALNNGIAVPHTRDFLLKGPNDLIAVVFPKEPVDWGALDEKPVHTLFFLFATDDKRHLHLLAKIAHLSSNEEALELLRSKPSEKELLSYLKKWEASIS